MVLAERQVFTGFSSELENHSNERCVFLDDDWRLANNAMHGMESIRLFAS